MSINYFTILKMQVHFPMLFAIKFIQGAQFIEKWFEKDLQKNIKKGNNK